MDYISVLPIGSGSTGNSLYIDMGVKFLIDTGLSCRSIRTALNANGISFEDIQALFITHTHHDHISGFRVTTKNMDVPVFSSKRTRDEMGGAKINGLPFYESREVLPGLYVTAFETSHDCPGSCGFTFEYEGKKVGYATDLGHIDERIIEVLYDSDVLIIESNHDVEMLKKGSYPYPLKRRILSEHGHLSNDECAGTCLKLNEGRTKHFLLAHLSRENNTPQKALETFNSVMEGRDYTVQVLSPRSEEMIIFKGERE